MKHNASGYVHGCRCDTCREAHRVKMRRYCDENREHLLRYREENQERIAAVKRRYRENNREAFLEYERRYREETKEYKKLTSAKYAARQPKGSPERHGKRYLDIEDATLMRDDISLVEMSALTGRGHASVKSRRATLRKQGRIE